MPLSATKQGFRPDIQGLRAIAVLSVIGYHAAIPGFGGGYLGVDVFFVISGYLIGGQIVREILRTGRLDFASFYARRARRILPASLTVIALTMLAALLLAPPLRATEIAYDAIAATLSAANLRFAIQGTDYLAGTTPSPFQHYWSLGVEEQFYILVPLVLLTLLIVLRSRPRAIVVAGVALTTVSFAVCLLWGTTSPWAYFALPARAWELGIGVFVAVIASRTNQLPPHWRHATAAGGGLLLLASGWLGSQPGFEHPGIGTLLPVLATSAIILSGELGHEASPALNRALGIRPAQLIGTLSFSLYLVHWPVLALAREHTPVGEILPPASLAIFAALSFPLAWLLWKFVERPFMHRQPNSVRERRPLIISGVATAAIVASLALAVPALATRPLTTDRVATNSATASELPAGTSYVPSNLRPLLIDAISDTGKLYSDGCQQITSASELKVCTFGPVDGAPVVLFGDSHAGRWFSALSSGFDGHPIRLITLTKSGCRSLESSAMWAGAENQSCVSWRTSAVQWLQHNPPKLLVLANHLGRSTSPDQLQISRWRAATESTVARFPTGMPVAILAETPEFGFSPPVCLSRHLYDAKSCSELRSIAVNSPVIDGVRLGAAEAGATFVDFTDWLCNGNRCPTVIGSTLVYTDEHHLSATFSTKLGDAVYAKLSPLIAKPGS